MFLVPTTLPACFILLKRHGGEHNWLCTVLGVSLQHCFSGADLARAVNLIVIVDSPRLVSSHIGQTSTCNEECSCSDPGRFVYNFRFRGYSRFATLDVSAFNTARLERTRTVLSALLQGRSSGQTEISHGGLVSANRHRADFLLASGLISSSETLASGLRALFRVEESHAGLPSHDVKRHMGVVRRLTIGSSSRQRSMVRFT